MPVLILIHRYLGIAVGLLMAMWCLSGVVMMYVSYPELDQTVRAAHLAPIDWSRCCRIDPGAMGRDDPIFGAQIEMLAGHPVLELTNGAGRKLVDLVSGAVVARISASTAESVAAGFLRPGTPSSAQSLNFDQWTVSGEFNRDRPLFRVALGDLSGTDLYVSGTTGRVVQLTTSRQRFWNRLGAIPHWLYFSELRHRPALWRAMLIGTSVVGTVLTLLGLYIGVHELIRHPPGRWSPYRGLNLWHHGAGLLFGILTLTWVLSGLLSMNPWGLLEGGDDHAERSALRGIDLSLSRLAPSLTALAAARPNAVEVKAVPLDRQLYWVLGTADGGRERLDASARPAPLGPAELRNALRAIGPVAMDLLKSEDAYYFAHHRSHVSLPVYRVVLPDASRTPYYVDPVSGEIIAKFDAGARGYRWWHEALHRGDFAPSLRRRPFWDVMMLALMAGVSTVCLTGISLAFRARPASRASGSAAS
jgi:PepSY-associated TM region